MCDEHSSIEVAVSKVRKFFQNQKMNENICDTPITGELVAKHMKESLGPHAVLRSIDGKRFAVGQGFASTMLRLQLTWDATDEDHLPKSVIVKTPEAGSLQHLMATVSSATAEESEKTKAAADRVTIAIHNAECDLYVLFGESPPIPMAKCYAALPITDRAPAMIILEDLSHIAAINPSFANGLTLPQVMEAVTVVARLHAWSLTTCIDWRSRIPALEDQEDLNKEDLTPIAPGLQLSKEKYPQHFGSMNVERLVALSSYESFLEIRTGHREFMQDVLIHGDFHMNNILYEKNQNGSVGDRLVALIDFQNVCQGSPMYDLVRLLCFSLSGKLRRQHQEEILRHYYNEVKSIAGDKFTVSPDQLRHNYDRLFALEAVFLVAWSSALIGAFVNGDGEQKDKNEKELLETIKATYDDAMVILGLFEIV